MKKQAKHKNKCKQKSHQPDSEARFNKLLDRLEAAIVLFESLLPDPAPTPEPTNEPKPEPGPSNTITQEEADVLVGSGEAEIPEEAIITEEEVDALVGSGETEE